MKKNIGANLSEEEVKLFEEKRTEAGYDSNAEFIKARCLSLEPKITVAAPSSVQTSEEEIHELKFQILRLNAELMKEKIENTRLKNERLKSGLPRAVQNRIAMQASETNGVQVPAVWENGAWRDKRPEDYIEPAREPLRIPEALYCYEADCKEKPWDRGLKNARRDHMITVHKWTSEQLDAVGDFA